nr:hypothetical protein [Ruegeria sp. HKCCD4884]
MVIVDRFVAGRSVVPNGDIPFLPTQAALEFGLLAMIINHSQHRGRLIRAQAFYFGREHKIDEQTSPTAERMRDDNGVQSVLHGSFGVTQ